jgi:hypothetical protein
MKIGYSNLLRHLVDAPEIEHGECESLQIVCPECREPVFKTERGTDESAQHFLSHYGADKAMVAQCELRVGALSSGDARTSAAEGRGQNLKLFLRVLRQMVEETSARYLARSATTRLPTVRQILAGGLTSEMLARARSEAIQTGLDQLLDLSRTAYRSGGYETDYGGVALTDRRQIGYAADMAATLFSPACRKDCRLLLAHGWAQAAAFSAQALEMGQMDDRETRMARILVDIPQMSSSAARRRLAQEDERVVGNALVVATHHAISTLHALNYAGWLARSR